MSYALATVSELSSMMGKSAGLPANDSMSLFHFWWSLTESTETPITFVLRLANSAASCATAPNSVVHTGVKSFGWLKRMP